MNSLNFNKRITEIGIIKELKESPMIRHEGSHLKPIDLFKYCIETIQHNKTNAHKNNYTLKNQYNNLNNNIQIFTPINENEDRLSLLIHLSGKCEKIIEQCDLDKIENLNNINYIIESLKDRLNSIKPLPQNDEYEGALIKLIETYIENLEARLKN